MTPELTRLRASFGALESILDSLELDLVNDPSWAEPSDTSYLSPSDRADPDIMANVEAMAATNALIAWFGRDMEGFVGLWRGPTNRPLDRAPVVRLDTEGQYRLVAPTIADYLAVSMPEDEFASARRTLVDAGFTVAASPEAVWERLDAFEAPDAHRHALYNEARAQRGLPPI